MILNDNYVMDLVQDAYALLEEYHVYVDSDMASFTEHYLKSLMLDVELAMTRGKAKQVLLVRSMLEELVEDTRSRVKEAKSSLLKAMSPYQTAVTKTPPPKTEACQEPKA